MWYTDTYYSEIVLLEILEILEILLEYQKYYSDRIKNEITLFSVTIDGTRDYHTKRIQTEKDKYRILLICRT